MGIELLIAKIILIAGIILTILLLWYFLYEIGVNGEDERCLNCGDLNHKLDWLKQGCCPTCQTKPWEIENEQKPSSHPKPTA